MKVLLLFFLFGLCLLTAKAQVDIRIKDYGILLSDFHCQDTLTIKLKAKKYALIKLHDCMGAMDIEIHNGNNIIEAGTYSNSLDTLKAYGTSTIFGPSAIRKIVIVKYFQPIKNGEWIYYKKNKIYRRVWYVDGFILKEEDY